MFLQDALVFGTRMYRAQAELPPAPVGSQSEQLSRFQHLLLHILGTHLGILLATAAIPTRSLTE